MGLLRQDSTLRNVQFRTLIPGELYEFKQTTLSYELVFHCVRILISSLALSSLSVLIFARLLSNLLSKFLASNSFD